MKRLVNHGKCRNLYLRNDMLKDINIEILPYDDMAYQDEKDEKTPRFWTCDVCKCKILVSSKSLHLLSRKHQEKVKEQQ
jgi:hypothetical protein